MGQLQAKYALISLLYNLILGKRNEGEQKSLTGNIDSTTVGELEPGAVSEYRSLSE